MGYEKNEDDSIVFVHDIMCICISRMLWGRYSKHRQLDYRCYIRKQIPADESENKRMGR